MSARLLLLTQTASALREPRVPAETPHSSGEMTPWPVFRPAGVVPALELLRTEEGGAVEEPYAGIRLTDVIGALSHALDMAEGQPVGHSIRTTMIGMRLGACIGINEQDRSALFYALLLKDLGSSSNAAQLAQLHGADDRVLKAARRLSDWTDRSFVGKAFGRTSDGRTRLHHAWRRLKGQVDDVDAEQGMAVVRAERGSAIASMLAMPPETCEAIRTMEEHWDGTGTPQGISGSAIPLLARIVGLAQTAEIFERAFDVATAYDVVHRRSGRWFDPELVAAFDTISGDAGFWLELRGADALGALRNYEPPARVVFANELRLDTIAEAFSRVIDAKSPYTARHSQNVSFLATRTAMELQLPPREVRALRRAALLHDIGKLGIGNGILDKSGPLTPDERIEMERHTNYTFDILKDVPRFARFARLAASHHERLDGSGYHLGLNAQELSLPARVLAAADVCEALSATRPYRAALPMEDVIRHLRDSVNHGSLCPVAVEALSGWFKGMPNHPVQLTSGGDSTSLFGI